MSAEIKIYNLENKLLESVALPEEIFAAEVSRSLLHEVIRAEEAAGRQGNAKTKTRGEVSGGGIKPWKQKGTGRARHGSIRSPIWRGGGTPFGPVPRGYRYKVNRKVKKAALAGALTARLQEDRIVGIDVADLKERKTGRVAGFLKQFEGIKRPLLVYVAGEQIVVDSFRNIAGAAQKSWEALSARSVLTSDLLVFTRGAVEALARKPEATK